VPLEIFNERKYHRLPQHGAHKGKIQFGKDKVNKSTMKAFGWQKRTVFLGYNQLRKIQDMLFNGKSDHSH